MCDKKWGARIEKHLKLNLRVRMAGRISYAPTLFVGAANLGRFFGNLRREQFKEAPLPSKLARRRDDV
jgi:hypothetical protein